MNKPKMIVWGSHGMGEIIHATPLLKAADRLYDVTLVVAAWQEPFVRSLSFYTGKVVAFTDTQARYGHRVKAEHGNRCLRITKAFAESLGVNEAQSIAPVLINGVCINDNLSPKGDEAAQDIDIPNLWQRRARDDQQNRSYPDKLCRVFGFDSADLRMYVTGPKDLCEEAAFNAYPTVVFCNSAEHLRAMPEAFVHSFMRKFNAVRFMFIGYLGSFNMKAIKATARATKNIVEFHNSEKLTAAEMEKSIIALHAANVIIGPDCGWTWVGLAAFKRVIFLESRTVFESLVPRIYWGQAVHYKKKVLNCDRMCAAEKQLAGAIAEFPEAKRPIEKWENYDAMTKEWQQTVYSGSYPRNLACWNTPCVPCLDYTLEDVAAIVEQAIEMYRPLNTRVKK